MWTLSSKAWWVKLLHDEVMKTSLWRCACKDKPLSIMGLWYMLTMVSLWWWIYFNSCARMSQWTRTATVSLSVFSFNLVTYLKKDTIVNKAIITKLGELPIPPAVEKIFLNRLKILTAPNGKSVLALNWVKSNVTHWFLNWPDIPSKSNKKTQPSLPLSWH